MKRREFIALVGGMAGTWPLTPHAQQANRMRRIGVLMVLPADDPEAQARLTAFAQGLQQLGLDRLPKRPRRLPMGQHQCRCHAYWVGLSGTKT